MKHIKTYKVFESITPDNIQDIKDILVEVEDMGYSITVRGNKGNKLWYIEVETKYTMVRWSELKEYVERIFEYLGNVMMINIMDISLRVNQHVSYIHDTDLNYPVYSISIFFEP